jgi:hypothetical protein
MKLEDFIYEQSKIAWSDEGYSLSFTSTQTNYIKKAMIEFGKQLLELAAENAEVDVEMCMGQRTGCVEVNKESIIDTIKQVE